jgi:type VI secretion system protein ImpL
MYLRIRRLIFNQISLLVLCSIILGIAIWYLGPLLALGEVRPFDTTFDRLIAIGALVAGTIIAVLIILLARRSRDVEITEAITARASAAMPNDDVIDAEIGEMRQRMKDALGYLRKSKLGGRFGSKRLYQLPWYIIIGPPGAGKTTAIINSGLQFPLAERMGGKAIGGVGGTRNCDWWFTNEAVLLDTAGRYTTQDSDQDADAKGWNGFLDMLKKHRKRQPINGAMIAISLSDISSQTDQERKQHAQAIRTRLHELRTRLGVRFPVYVLFTKADLIAGFQEFFDNLGSEEREQVWGFTLPMPTKGENGNAMVAFDTEFDRLLNQLGDHSLERMQAETDYQRRSLISGFPAQMASLKGVAAAFLGDVFQDSRYEENQLLRGIYFTSGTQEGMPIDRLMMGMSRTFGIGRQAIGTGQGQGRSYFLTRLLNGVIFNEAGLVSADDAVERRYRWATRGAIATSVLIFGGILGVLTNSYVGNVNLISDAQAKVAEFRQVTENIPGNPIADQNILSVVPALNILRDLPGNPAATDPEPPRAVTYGLYQGDVIGSETAQSYRGALNSLLLPRLLFRLEGQMQANLNNSDLLFEALKVYLMLGLQGPMDETQVKQFMRIDWEIAFPAEDDMRNDLLGHLDEMVNQPMQQIALNGPLVDQVRAILAETPLSERVYQSIVKSPAARDLVPFRITDIGGPAVSRVLLRPSGTPLSVGVDGVYTHAGFHEYFLPEVLVVAERIQQESQILGPANAANSSPQALAAISRDVLDLYENDYVNQYDKLLADIDIIPMESLGQATDVINILSGPTSPIRNILEAVSKETKLTELPGDQALAENASSTATGFVQDEITSALDAQSQALFAAIGSVVTNTGEEPAQAQPGQFVESRFSDLHELADGFEGGPSQLDNVIATMTDVYDELNRLSLGQNLGTAIVGGGNNAAARLQAEIGRLPSPMQRWASQVASASSGAAVGGARTELNAKWQAQVLPFCERAIDGRYPFDRQAISDVALQDFGRLFGPSGMIDTFFNENLIAFVDTTTNPWRSKQVNGVDIGISNAVIAQFQKASEIRDSFFLSPGLPSVTFDLTPVALDPNAEQITLDVEGQSLIYAHGPPQVTAMTWPGQVGGRTRVSFSPTQSTIESTVTRDGPWAWFRLLDTAEVRRTNVSDRNRIIFNIGGRIAIFQLRAGSALNPFTIPAIDSFSCPNSL